MCKRCLSAVRCIAGLAAPPSPSQTSHTDILAEGVFFYFGLLLSDPKFHSEGTAVRLIHLMPRIRRQRLPWLLRSQDRRERHVPLACEKGFKAIELQEFALRLFESCFVTLPFPIGTAKMEISRSKLASNVENKEMDVSIPPS